MYYSNLERKWETIILEGEMWLEKTPRMVMIGENLNV